MKKIVIGLFSLLLLALSGCVHDNVLQPVEPLPEGSEVTVRFTTSIPEYQVVETRANGGVNDMWLLVFDQNGTFIVRSKAILSAQTETGGTFTVKLPASNNKRFVHFVCNYDWTGFNDADMIGANAAAAIAVMSTNSATFWARKELTGGINTNSFTGGNVELLRNQAKISVTNEAANFTLQGFTLHKTPDKGTVAPFNTSTFQFTKGAIIEPAGMTLVDAAEGQIGTGEKYTFERKNKNASVITTVIVKGIYNSKTCFYKIDLINAEKERYDIERNFHYAVKIKTVTKEGYANFSDALNGASHNNTALDPIIEKYPMISDGTSKLEVEKTLVVFTQPGQPLNVWVKYYPDVNSTTVDNSGVTAVLTQNDGALADGSLSFNTSTGIITATSAATMPTEPKEARIVVTKGDLARTIRVVMRPAFSFTPVTINDLNPAELVGGQNAVANLRFTIPADFPADLLPLPVKIYTQGLYPAAPGLQMIVEQGVIHYIYLANTTGVQGPIMFKTNKSGNAETVKVQADYFADGTVGYSPKTYQDGNITYGGANVTIPANTQVPAGTTISASTGSISVTSNGQFRYNLPATYNNNTSVTFTYEKQVNVHYKEVYAMTTTIGTLLDGAAVNLTPTNFVFEGTVQYWWNNRWNDLMLNDPGTQSTSLGTFVHAANGRYKLTIPSTTQNNVTITVSVRWNNTYQQSKSVAQFKADAKLELRR